MPEPQISVSVVSHGQNALAAQLLSDLGEHCRGEVRAVVTENVPDPASLAAPAAYPVEIVRNSAPKGFGANHNAAFARCATPFFCVVNPDIRLKSNPFPRLRAALDAERAGVAGPLVRSPAGKVEDSARRYPTAASLLRKLFVPASGPDYPTDGRRLEVDWVAGMFMLFRSEVFRAVHGFDEAYFLYYEDVDICRRLRRAGYGVAYAPDAEVVHDARRASRRDLSHMRHHAASIVRFLLR